MKRILKALFSFIPSLLNFSNLPSYDSNLRKRYTLRLLSKCIGRSIPTIVPIKSKLNQTPYVIFQAMSQFPFKFCITFQCHNTKFLWNFQAELLHFGQKEPIKVQILTLSCALMKVHPITHTSFETTRSRFIQILHHCSGSSMIIPLYFFSSNLYTSHKK